MKYGHRGISKYRTEGSAVVHGRSARIYSDAQPKTSIAVDHRIQSPRTTSVTPAQGNGPTQIIKIRKKRSTRAGHWAVGSGDDAVELRL